MYVCEMAQLKPRSLFSDPGLLQSIPTCFRASLNKAEPVHLETKERWSLLAKGDLWDLWVHSSQIRSTPAKPQLSSSQGATTSQSGPILSQKCPRETGTSLSVGRDLCLRDLTLSYVWPILLPFRHIFLGHWPWVSSLPLACCAFSKSPHCQAGVASTLPSVMYTPLPSNKISPIF